MKTTHTVYTVRLDSVLYRHDLLSTSSSSSMDSTWSLSRIVSWLARTRVVLEVLEVVTALLLLTLPVQRIGSHLGTQGVTRARN